MSKPDQDLDERLQEYVNVAAESPPGPPARDPVNRPMIHHWCDAIGDTNPSYVDEELAAQSVHGGLVAPPTMLQAWGMGGLRGRGPSLPEPARAPAPAGGDRGPVALHHAAEHGHEGATAESGPWRVTLDIPSYLPFLKYATRRDLREQLYRAMLTRASADALDNSHLIERILALRVG